MINGQLFYIDFSGNIGSEVNKFHPEIVFTIPKTNNKHFKNE